MAKVERGATTNFDIGFSELEAAGWIVREEYIGTGADRLMEGMSAACRLGRFRVSVYQGCELIYATRKKRSGQVAYRLTGAEWFSPIWRVEQPPQVRGKEGWDIVAEGAAPSVLGGAVRGMARAAKALADVQKKDGR